MNLYWPRNELRYPRRDVRFVRRLDDLVALNLDEIQHPVVAMHHALDIRNEHEEAVTAVTNAVTHLFLDLLGKEAAKLILLQVVAEPATLQRLPDDVVCTDGGVVHLTVLPSEGADFLNDATVRAQLTNGRLLFLKGLVVYRLHKVALAGVLAFGGRLERVRPTQELGFWTDSRDVVRVEPRLVEQVVSFGALGKVILHVVVGQTRVHARPPPERAHGRVVKHLIPTLAHPQPAQNVAHAQIVCEELNHLSRETGEGVHLRSWRLPCLFPDEPPVPSSTHHLVRTPLFFSLI